MSGAIAQTPSSRTCRAKIAAAIHHLRLGRRRQIDLDRPHAVRRRSRAGRSLGDAGEGLQEARHSGRGARFRAARRRARRGARARHHHRRRLSLFRDRKAQVHRRGHARTRTIHPQHGDRRLHRRPRGPAGRRAKGNSRADPASQRDRVDARRASRRRRGQQDGSRRQSRGRLSQDRGGFPRVRRTPALRDDLCAAARRQGWRQSRQARRQNALVRRAAAARLSRDDRAGGRFDHRAVPLSRAVGQPPEPRFPRFFRLRLRRQRATGRSRAHPAAWPRHADRAHCDGGWRFG